MKTSVFQPTAIIWCPELYRTLVAPHLVSSWGNTVWTSGRTWIRSPHQTGIRPSINWCVCLGLLPCKITDIKSVIPKPEFPGLQSLWKYVLSCLQHVRWPNGKAVIIQENTVGADANIKAYFWLVSPPPSFFCTGRNFITLVQWQSVLCCWEMLNSNYVCHR